MLWLIWIAIMLLTPIVAGVNIWWENRARANDTAIHEVLGEQM
jgi:hypothetical protein